MAGPKSVSPRVVASSAVARRVLPSFGTIAFIEPEMSTSTSTRPLRVAVAHRCSAASDTADSVNGVGAGRSRTVRPSGGRSVTASPSGVRNPAAPNAACPAGDRSAASRRAAASRSAGVAAPRTVNG